MVKDSEEEKKASESVDPNDGYDESGGEDGEDEKDLDYDEAA